MPAYHLKPKRQNMLVTNPAEPTEMPACVFLPNSYLPCGQVIPVRGLGGKPKAFLKAIEQHKDHRGREPCVFTWNCMQPSTTHQAHTLAQVQRSPPSTAGMVMELNVSWGPPAPRQISLTFHIYQVLSLLKGNWTTQFQWGLSYYHVLQYFMRTLECFTILARQFMSWLLKSIYYVEIQGEDGITTAWLEVLCEELQ